ncbi:MAG: hypothetical protein QM715_11330 [Nibricoccus sp.]
MSPRFKRKKRETASVDTSAVYSKEGIIFESQYIARWFVLGIGGLLILLSLGIVIFGFSFAPGYFEPADTHLFRKQLIVRGGQKYGPGGRQMVEYYGTNGFLYNENRESLGYFTDVGISRADAGENRQVPVRYSQIWKSAIYPVGDVSFKGISVGAIIPLVAGLSFIFIYRKHLRLTPVKSKYC